MPNRPPEALVGFAPQHAASYLALMRFAEQGEDSPTLWQLAHALGVTSPSTVVRRVTAMEAEGMIAREPWDGKKRVRYKLLLG